jgi:hypothetical protein
LLKARRDGGGSSGQNEQMSQTKNNKKYLILTHLINAPGGASGSGSG